MVILVCSVLCRVLCVVIVCGTLCVVMIVCGTLCVVMIVCGTLCVVMIVCVTLCVVMIVCGVLCVMIVVCGVLCVMTIVCGVLCVMTIVCGVLCVMIVVCGVLCVIGAPGVPIGLHVYHVADGEICVAWAPPSTNGGSEVTSYLIDASLTGMPHCRRVGTVDSTTTSFVLTDLPVGGVFHSASFLRKLSRHQSAGCVEKTYLRLSPTRYDSFLFSFKYLYIYGK